MGTRSMIAIQNPHSKQVRAVYCHWDGYLEHNGAILQKHYADSPKVNHLIAMGDVSSLGKQIGEAHPFSPYVTEDEAFKALPKAEQERIKAETKALHEHARDMGYCTFYKRDRGESDVDFKVFNTLKQAEDHYTWSDYYYVFKYTKASDYTTGEWFYKQPSGRWKKLAPAVAKLNKDECAA